MEVNAFLLYSRPYLQSNEQHRDKTNKMACAPSEDSDQPGHPPRLIRVFAIRLKKARTLSYPLSAQRRLWSDWGDAQADPSLRWAHMPFCWFCHDAVQISATSWHWKLPTNIYRPVTFCNYYDIWAATWQNQQNDCAPSEDSEKPGHPPSLIRVFAVRMKKSWDLSYPLSAERHSEDSDQTGRTPRLSWVFAGRTLILLVSSCRGSFVHKNPINCLICHLIVCIQFALQTKPVRLLSFIRFCCFLLTKNLNVSLSQDQPLYSLP